MHVLPDPEKVKPWPPIDPEALELELDVWVELAFVFVSDWTE